METWAGGVAEFPDDVPAEVPTGRPSRVSQLVEVGVALLVIAALALLGVAVGFIWSAVAQHVDIIVAADGLNLRPGGGDEFFAGEGAFALIGIAVGVLTSLVAWHGLRRWRGPLLVAALVVGGLAGAVVAWQVGRHLGLGEYRELVRSTEVGRTFSRPVDVRSKGLLLAQPMLAAVTYVLLVCWISEPDLRRSKSG